MAKRLVTVKIPQELYELMMAVAEKEGASTSVLLRKALAFYIFFKNERCIDERIIKMLEMVA